MSSRRNRRTLPKVDYAKLNGEKKRTKKNTQVMSSSSEEELDYVDVDLQGEAELVGDFNDEMSDVSKEEGECDSEGESSGQEDEQIKECMEKGDLEKLKKILKLKEERCRRLQREVKKEHDSQKKKKEMQAILERIQQADRTACNLERSLANSRESTPKHSPVKSKKSGSSKKRGQRKEDPRNKEQDQDKKSEYRDVLSSMLELKQGSNEPFSELALRAMEATDNIFSIKKQRENQKSEDSENETELETDNNLIEKVCKFKNKRGQPLSQEELFDLLASLNNNKVKDHIHTGGSSHNTGKLTVKEDGRFKNKSNKGDSIHTSEDEENGSNKRLKSGKCTRPEEVDILKTVKFPHEKLDTKHMQIKNFDHLPFNLLLAGKLETIALGAIGGQERLARIGVAKTMCYHKLYLEDHDLRNGYDNVMKQIEQGILQWQDQLGEKLHDHYVFRANINLRNKVENGNFKQQEKKLESQENKTEKIIPEGEKIVYCQDYNKKSCLHNDHHEGRFMGKKTTKWHVCSKCLKVGEKKSHPSIDCGRIVNSS